MMMEHKRCPVSLEQNTVMTLTPKRLKAGLSVTSKDKKEKFGERIVALQQLVSPYGKTDTASVLCEALEYIKFLHEQVKVLSAPYLCSSTPAAAYMIQEEEEAYRYSLRSKGLPVVPVSYTAPLLCSKETGHLLCSIIIPQVHKYLVSDDSLKHNTEGIWFLFQSSHKSISINLIPEQNFYAAAVELKFRD